MITSPQVHPTRVHCIDTQKKGTTMKTVCRARWIGAPTSSLLLFCLMLGTLGIQVGCAGGPA